MNPDLREFFGQGGKLLLIGGWSDGAVPPQVAVDYYKRVIATVGARAASESLRFFMVPGMDHGPGTAGPDNFSFDSLGILEEWRRTGRPPDQLIVSHHREGKEIGKRVVCQYPRVAVYSGTGNGEEPGHYVCR